MTLDNANNTRVILFLGAQSPHNFQNKMLERPRFVNKCEWPSHTIVQHSKEIAALQRLLKTVVVFQSWIKRQDGQKTLFLIPLSHSTLCFTLLPANGK